MTTDSDYARAIDLLVRDVVATVGEKHAAYVLARAAELREFDLADTTDQLVEDVHQEIHDTYVDTSWPECPHHGKHPLWYRNGAWYCDHLESRSPDWETGRRRAVELARGWFAEA